MEWIVEAECKVDLVDGWGLIGQELVRCKDCRHRKKPECPMCDYIRQHDGVYFRVIDRAKDDGFCDEGERREDE